MNTLNKKREVRTIDNNKTLKFDSL